MKIFSSKTIVLATSIIAVLFIIFFSVMNNYKIKQNTEENKLKNNSTQELLVFVQDGCYYCRNAELFLANQKFKNLKITYHNLKDRNSQTLLFRLANKFNIPKNKLGTPIFIFNEEYIIGFSDSEEKKLMDILKNSK